MPCDAAFANDVLDRLSRLTRAQWKVFRRMADPGDDPLSVRNLARQLHLSPWTVQVAIRRFDDLDLVRVDPGSRTAASRYRVLVEVHPVLGSVPIPEEPPPVRVPIPPPVRVPVSEETPPVRVPISSKTPIVRVPIPQGVPVFESTESATCDGPSRAFHSLHSLTNTGKKESVSECSASSSQTVAISEMVERELRQFKFRPGDPLRQKYDSLPQRLNLPPEAVMRLLHRKIKAKGGPGWFTSLGGLLRICEPELEAAAALDAGETPRKPPAVEEVRPNAAEDATCDGPSRAFHSLHSLTNTGKKESVSECSASSSQTVAISEMVERELRQFKFRPGDPLRQKYDSLPQRLNLPPEAVMRLLHRKIKAKGGPGWFTSLGGLLRICEPELEAAAALDAGETPRKPPAVEEVRPNAAEDAETLGRLLDFLPNHEHAGDWQNDYFRLTGHYHHAVAASGGAR